MDCTSGNFGTYNRQLGDAIDAVCSAVALIDGAVCRHNRDALVQATC